MGYKVKMTNRTVREAKIKAAVAVATETDVFWDFRGQKTKLKVIRIEVGLPIYRMENYRAYTEQKEYTIREKKPGNYFQAGQENESIQQLQHEILAKLARTGREGSITPVIEVLKKERQREPLLMTHTGMMVNGNRRLAAMRELGLEPGFTEFEYVTCMVLPEDTLPEEIVDIEAALQAKPETRLDYDWVGDCQLIKRLQSMGRSIVQIGDKLNRKEKEIKNSLQALTEAELYLKEWAGSEDEYSKVSDAEQFFKDIPDLLQGKTPQLEQGSRVIAWTLFDNKADLGDRLYAFNSTFGKRAADVLDRVAGDLGLPLETISKPPGDSEFAVDIAEEETTVSYEPVIKALRDPAKREQAVEILIEACKGVIEFEKSKKSGNAALKAVSTAHSKLIEVDLSKADPDTFGAIDKQLDAIIKKSAELKTKVEAYQAALKNYV
jgi:hypothetical protein